MDKDTRKKTRRTKNYVLTANEVAIMVGCSESYVKKLRTGVVAHNSPKAQAVLAVDKVVDDGKNLLISEVRRILNKQL